MSYSASGGSGKKLPSRVKSGGSEKKEQVTQNGHHLKSKKKAPSPSPNKSSSENDTDDDEPIRAPIQLKAEFVNAIMFRQWAVAKKLCHFILMYEPSNVEAKQYAPLIDYMLNKEQSESSSDDDDSSDSSDDDSSDSSSSSSPSAVEGEQTSSPPPRASKPVNASQSSKITNHN